MTGLKRSRRRGWVAARAKPMLAGAQAVRSQKSREHIVRWARRGRKVGQEEELWLGDQLREGRVTECIGAPSRYGVNPGIGMPTAPTDWGWFSCQCKPGIEGLALSAGT